MSNYDGTNYGPGFPPMGRVIKQTVYGGDAEIAVLYANYAKVYWTHVNPVTNSKGHSFDVGGYFPDVEPDPTGAHVGLDEPVSNPDPPSSGGEGVPIFLFPTGGDPFIKVTVDGAEIPWAEAQKLISSASARIAPTNTFRPVVWHGKLTWAKWQSFQDGYEGYVPMGACPAGDGVLKRCGNGSPQLYRSYHSGLKDNVAEINGATGEAELRRSSDFGWQQDRIDNHPDKGHNVIKGSKSESCVVTLVARKINFDDVPVLGWFDSSLKYYHVFVTTGPSKGGWDWLYHGMPNSEGQLVTESRAWETAGPDDNNWDRAAYEKYGGIAVDETVPRSCDSIKGNFNAILGGIRHANIEYYKFNRNSNSTIYTMLRDYDRDLLNRLSSQLWEKMPYGAKVTLFPIVGVGTPIPGWGVRLKY